MFTNFVSPESFGQVSEFIQKFEPNRDFVWWLDTLMLEEFNELIEAIESGEKSDILHELCDLFWVTIGFVIHMPMHPDMVVSAEKNQDIMNKLDTIENFVMHFMQRNQMNISLINDGIALLHAANMSKLGADGEVIRREDGKVMKGPNFKKADFTELANQWAEQMDSLELQFTNVANIKQHIANGFPKIVVADPAPVADEAKGEAQTGGDEVAGE